MLSLEVLRFDGCHKGNEVHLQIGLGPLKQRWVSLITQDHTNENEMQFIDEGKVLPPPLSFWRHTHRVVKTGNESCEIFDEVEFNCNNKILEKSLYPLLKFQFSLRTAAYQRYFPSARK